MNEVLHSNIFFFITGIATIFFSVFLCVALYHFIRILKIFRRIIEKIEEGTEVIAEDMQQFRGYIRDGGFISRIISMLMGPIRRSSNGEGRSKRAEKKKTELKIKDKS